jgi:hypothetical protein
MWRRPRLVTADTKSPAPQPGSNVRWRGAFALDPATGTEAGPGLTTPRRSAVRRASRLRGRARASQAWRRALLRDTYQGWTSLGAPPIPSIGDRQRPRRKGRKKNPDAKRAGAEETGLFEMVNRKRCGAMHRRDAAAPSRQRQRTRLRPRARVGMPSSSVAERVERLCETKRIVRAICSDGVRPRCARAATDRSPRLRAATDPARRSQPIA